MSTAKEKSEELLKRIEAGIKDVISSDNFQNYLRFVSKFHHYSLNNSILLFLQNPNVTHVAGYAAWQKKFHRQVKKGEKGLTIFRPQKVQRVALDEDGNPVLDEDGNPVQKVYLTFYPATVFDVSQTTGDPLPELESTTLTADVSNYDDFMKILRSVSKYPIEFENITFGAEGYFDRSEHRIAIQENMPQLQTISVMLHEIVHSYLHDVDPATLPPKEFREVEAETTAFIIADHFGLDTSADSFSYLANWGQQDYKELHASFQKCIKQADELIVKIETEFAELQKDVQKQQTHQDQASVYLLDNDLYLLVQASDDSYDYTIFNHDLTVLDGGRLDNATLSISDARDEILLRHTLSPKTIDVIFLEQFEQLRSAAEMKRSNTFSIYQLTNEDKTLDYRFEPLDSIHRNGLAVDPANYELVYTAPLTEQDNLESIYTRFNIDRPAGFTGHSLSVSDIVVLHENGKNTAHYCDRVGFTEVPEFLALETPVYQHTAEYASEHGEMNQYRTSYKLNLDCKEAIEAAISKHYHNNHLDCSAAVKQVVTQFGAERVFYVLANTVQRKDWDGRISPDNKAWAKAQPVCDDSRNPYFVVDQVNPGLADLFLSRLRKEFPQVNKESKHLKESTVEDLVSSALKRAAVRNNNQQSAKTPERNERT